MVSARKPLSHGQTIATCQRIISQHCWANMLSAFDHGVATCWVLLAQVWKWSNLSQQHSTHRNMSQYGGQTRATCWANNVAYFALAWIVWPGLYEQNQRCLLNWISCFRVISYGQANHSVSISRRWIEPQKNGRFFPYSYWLLITHHQSSCHRGRTADQWKTSFGSLEARCYNNSQWNSRENISLAVKP